jgi:hypothetical protein
LTREIRLSVTTIRTPVILLHQIDLNEYRFETENIETTQAARRNTLSAHRPFVLETNDQDPIRERTGLCQMAFASIKSVSMTKPVGGFGKYSRWHVTWRVRLLYHDRRVAQKRIACHLIKLGVVVHLQKNQ